MVCYRHRNRAVTHAQLRENAVRLVSAMVAAGMSRQDRIAVLSRNSIEFGELNAAVQLSGIIMATINFRLSPAEMDDALGRVAPSIVFCTDEFTPVMLKLVAEMRPPPLLVIIDGPAPQGAIGYQQFIDTARGRELALLAQPEDIAYLLFTSGTTGAAKCCMLGQREMHQVAFSMNSEMRCGSSDRGLINMPMFHVGALAIIGGLHARGGSVVLQQQFDAAEAAQLIAEDRVTVLHLAPVMLNALLDVLDEETSMESVRTVVYAAAPMNAATLRRALASLPHAGFVNLYGQTEVTVSGLPPELHVLDRPEIADQLRSVGFPFPGTRVRVVDDNGDVVPVGAAGEIVVRSDSMFRGYWQDPAATQATLKHGWCHTGDIGRFDERGLLYLVDRKKDVIISGGENIYSPEVEDAVCAVDGVAACAVVGVPDDTWGEAVCAVVVPGSGATPTLEAVQEGVRRHLARYKVPRRLELVTGLPTLASGKVDKKRLRAELGK